MAYTDIDNPELYFQAKAWTGTGSEIAITFDGSENMQPDWVWLKRRDASAIHVAHDSVRGATKRLIPNSTDAETTQAQYVKSFDSNGITFGTDTDVNNSGSPAILWGWKAGGSASSNTDGSITSSVSANTTAGFSIVTYSGNSTAGATVGHGLGVVPSVVLVKSRGGTYGWGMYHHKNTSAPETEYLSINNTDATVDDVNFWNDTAPTSSVFSLGGTDAINKTSNSHVAYCFAEKKGYSKFGSYTGNGNADGTFVYTGFKPAMMIFKPTSTTGNWFILDNKRDTINPLTLSLFPNLSDVETGTYTSDFLSNGIKIRLSGNPNSSGVSYIYMAFAESPFVNSNGVPTNAR